MFETPRRRNVYKHAFEDVTVAATLSGAESERAERIARLYALAEQVLGDEAEARAFLFSPHPQLDGHRPIDWMRTEIGGRDVEQILVNVREAVPS